MTAQRESDLLITSTHARYYKFDCDRLIFILQHWCDWLIELSDNKLSNNKLSYNKLSNNNLASELAENTSF